MDWMSFLVGAAATVLAECVLLFVAVALLARAGRKHREAAAKRTADFAAAVRDRAMASTLKEVRGSGKGH